VSTPPRAAARRVEGSPPCTPRAVIFIGDGSDVDEGARTPSVWGDNGHHEWIDPLLSATGGWCGAGSGGGPGDGHILNAQEYVAKDVEEVAETIGSHIGNAKLGGLDGLPPGGRAGGGAEAADSLRGATEAGCGIGSGGGPGSFDVDWDLGDGPSAVKDGGVESMIADAGAIGKRVKKKARRVARLNGVWQRAWNSISPELQAEVEKGAVSLEDAVSRMLREAEQRVGVGAAAA
jgi:hypothetical protein